jgi:hypothetical protein
MNSFIVYYDEKIVDLDYNDEKFSFNLNDGDVGDFWDSFTTKDGVLKDINFYQEDSSIKPSLSVYDVDDDGYIITTYEEVLECSSVYGDPDNYFNQ